MSNLAKTHTNCNTNFTHECLERVSFAYMYILPYIIMQCKISRGYQIERKRVCKKFFLKFFFMCILLPSHAKSHDKKYSCHNFFMFLLGIWIFFGYWKKNYEVSFSKDHQFMKSPKIHYSDKFEIDCLSIKTSKLFHSLKVSFCLLHSHNTSGEKS